MKVEIHCKGMPLTDAIRDHVNDRLGKLERLLPAGVDILTILDTTSSRQGGAYSAEVSFRVWSHDVVAKEEDDDVYKAMAAAADQVLGQTRRLKDKRKTSRKGRQSLKDYVPPTPDTNDLDEDELEDMGIEFDPTEPSETAQTIKPSA